MKLPKSLAVAGAGVSIVTGSVSPLVSESGGAALEHANDFADAVRSTQEGVDRTNEVFEKDFRNPTTSSGPPDPSEEHLGDNPADPADITADHGSIDVPIDPGNFAATQPGEAENADVTAPEQVSQHEPAAEPESAPEPDTAPEPESAPEPKPLPEPAPEPDPEPEEEEPEENF